MKTRLVGDFSSGKSLLLGFELSFVLKISCHQTKYKQSENRRIQEFASLNPSQSSRSINIFEIFADES